MEIKFRARKDGKLYYFTGLKEIAMLGEDFHNYSNWEQWSGLKDKKKQDIFENDILTYTVGCHNEDGLVRKNNRGKHVFHAIAAFENGYFVGMVIRGNGNFTSSFPLKVLESEIIEGNILHRPEICFLRS